MASKAFCSYTVMRPHPDSFWLTPDQPYRRVVILFGHVTHQQATAFGWHRWPLQTLEDQLRIEKIPATEPTKRVGG